MRPAASAARDIGASLFNDSQTLASKGACYPQRRVVGRVAFGTHFIPSHLLFRPAVGNLF
jgi:hypothetical protein